MICHLTAKIMVMTMLAPNPAGVNESHKLYLIPDGDPNDWADYTSAAEIAELDQISADIRAGRSRTYTSKEVGERLAIPDCTPEELDAILSMIE